MQMVDSNSVNYAESSGRGDYHTEYDSDPVSIYDPEVRKEVSEDWKSPVTGYDYINDPNYFDMEKSKKDADEKLEGI
ncbi:DUF3114 domain-containing protein [Streptococcus pluranimalium]|uniref:Uncharacterized protein n=1 Tax=Streptococcus pluranimalium TaxID=82348 RepID=A0A2L0D3W9_9STRE|nr:DUF3114 domain-containing protein [Streptococcus pluranimalium]AUW96330.1 hypothetical protein C0J00_03965 [Streptococcus pluranimalium]